MEEKKKIKIVINIIVIILILGLLGVLYNSGIKLKKANNEIDEIKGLNKNAITAEKFKSAIMTKDFTINVLQDAFSEEAIKKDGIKKGYLTKKLEDEEYRINFFELEDENSEEYMFYKEINIIRSEDNGELKETIEKSMNHTKYTALTNGKYEVISRIGNTIIWGTIDADKKQILVDLLNELGY